MILYLILLFLSWRDAEIPFLRPPQTRAKILKISTRRCFFDISCRNAGATVKTAARQRRKIFSEKIVGLHIIFPIFIPLKLRV